MAFISKSTFQNMVKSSGTKPGDVVRTLMSQGHQIEGMDQFQKQAAQPAAQNNQSSNPLTGALDWLHKSTQGLREGIDKWGDQSGANKWAGNVTQDYQKFKEQIPGAGATLNTLEGVGNVGANAVPAFAQGIGNQMKAVGDFTGIGALSGAGSNVTGFGDYVKNINGADQNSFSGQAGNFLGNLASQVPAMVGGSKLVQGAGNLLGQGLTRGTQVAQIGGNVNKAVNAAKFLGQSALGTEAATASNQGRLASSGELAAGAALDTGMLGLGKVLGGIGKGIMGNTIPTTPTQKALLQNRGIDIGENLIKDIGFVKNKADYIPKIQAAVKKYETQLDQEIVNSTKVSKIVKMNVKPKTFTSAIEGELSGDVKKMIDQAPLSEASKIQAAFDEELSAVQSHLKKELGGYDVTPRRILKIKRYFDGKINYDKTNPIMNVKDAVNKAVADKARALLDQVSPGITNINAKMGPLLEALGTLRKKGGYSGHLGDLTAAAGGFAGGGLLGAAKAVVTKRIAGSVPVRTGAATGAYNLGKILQKVKPLNPLSFSALGKNIVQPPSY